MSRAINVVQKLWSAGVSADITYDVSQVSNAHLASVENLQLTCLPMYRLCPLLNHHSEVDFEVWMKNHLYGPYKRLYTCKS